MFNKVTLIGNLGRDPDSKFSLATNENYRDRNNEWQTRTEWHEIVCWGNMAERVEKILRKGSLAFVEGKLTTRKWQDKNGNDRYTTEVVAGIVKSLDKRESGSSGIPDTGFPSIEDRFETATPTSTTTPEAPTATPVEDDLPF